MKVPNPHKSTLVRQNQPGRVVAGQLAKRTGGDLWAIAGHPKREREMASDLPFRIVRTVRKVGDSGYEYTLARYNGDQLIEVIMTSCTNQPIAPPSLRKLQARLNTKAVLDRIIGD